MQNKLGQFFTAAWAAEQLFDAHFGYLTAKDMMWEPTCGPGHMLSAIPAHIPCIGTEIDPILAQRARIASGRPVITGNCLEVELPPITAIFGNPPFSSPVFKRLIDRCSTLLQPGQKAGFILPAYFFGYARQIMKFNRLWTLNQEIIPRDLFPQLSMPLIFGSFIRDNRPHLIGFRLFPELAAMKLLSAQVQENLSTKVNGTRSVWRETIKQALTDLGGTAPLADIYRHMEGRRPTKNQFWKEKIRQVCQLSFSRVEEGVYSINN